MSVDSLAATHIDRFGGSSLFCKLVHSRCHRFHLGQWPIHISGVQGCIINTTAAVLAKGFYRYHQNSTETHNRVQIFEKF